MNTPSTQGQERLWSKDFWLVSIAGLLLTMAATMLIPTLPQWLLSTGQLSFVQVGIAMGAFAAGMVVPGAFCSYLVQRYRRNMVFVLAVLALAAVMCGPLRMGGATFTVLVLWRMLLGLLFGLAQMVLVSTLIIDTCESNQRTEGNHSATWFSRFALSLGPITGLLLCRHLDFSWVLMGAAACCVVSALLVLTIHFPFRVPEGKLHLVSLDRFFLQGSWPMFVNLLAVTTAVGIVLSLFATLHSFGFLMVGFLLALLAQLFVFREAELKSEIVSGIILLMASQLILLTSPQSPLASPLLGLGVGIVGGRSLLFFVKLSRHCQRGTSQSTFILAWESGLALGVGLGYLCFAHNPTLLLYVSIVISVLALAFYVAYTHQWFMKHKTR